MLHFGHLAMANRDPVFLVLDSYQKLKVGISQPLFLYIRQLLLKSVTCESTNFMEVQYQIPFKYCHNYCMQGLFFPLKRDLTLNILIEDGERIV